MIILIIIGIFVLRNIDSLQTKKNLSLNSSDLFYIASGEKENINNFDPLGIISTIEKFVGCPAGNKLYTYSKKNFERLATSNLSQCERLKSANIDSLGQIWTGGGGMRDGKDVLVFDKNGNKIKTLSICLNPNAGIHFYQDKAYIVCGHTGFTGEVLVVSINNFEVLSKFTMTNQVEGEPFLAISSIIHNNMLLVASGSYIQVYSLDSLKLVQQITYLQNLNFDGSLNEVLKEDNEQENSTDIWEMIPYKNTVILLNVKSWKNEGLGLVILEQDQLKDKYSVTKKIKTFKSPLWATVESNMLYMYHNPEWNQANNDESRKISIINLDTYEQKIYDLPNGLGINDMEFLNNQLLLAVSQSNSFKDGIYTYDFEQNKINLLMEVNGPTKIIF